MTARSTPPEKGFASALACHAKRPICGRQGRKEKPSTKARKTKARKGVLFGVFVFHAFVIALNGHTLACRESPRRREARPGGIRPATAGWRGLCAPARQW